MRAVMLPTSASMWTLFMAYQVLLSTESSLAIWHRAMEFFGVVFGVFSSEKSSISFLTFWFDVGGQVFIMNDSRQIARPFK
jgi:hypothetical protein